LLKLELLLKFTKYFNENISETCWFISVDTPPDGSSSDGGLDDVVSIVYGGNKREVTEDRATAIRRWVRKPDPQSQLMMG
jgi:hypothetical protein